ncbi:7-carboxy-7-deazaguanine synthase QueE [Kitasatospora sp. NPDC050463]|uniref:7-carboxy-7-deazaguanine synthase QueE n=1 Tax=Kitasatospora sp. NPDC050463 TaxID=3155786 RepID=UPI0033D78C6D
MRAATLTLTEAAEALSLWIAETFADTIQGEGPSTGVPALFIRTSGCNLECRPWCDTPFTWDRSRFDLSRERTRMSVAEVAAWALARPEPLAVVTGGEPLMQQRALVPLVRTLIAGGKRVEIETNGTYRPYDELVATGVHFNVSPKLGNSGMAADRRIRDDVLRAFSAAPQRAFKFVVCSPTDLDEIDGLVERLALDQVWVMPEGTTAQVVTTGMKALVPALGSRGYRLGTRLHTLMWGDERGR